jgi:hypothetical protein
LGHLRIQLATILENREMCWVFPMFHRAKFEISMCLIEEAKIYVVSVCSPCNMDMYYETKGIATIIKCDEKKKMNVNSSSTLRTLSQTLALVY